MQRRSNAAGLSPRAARTAIASIPAKTASKAETCFIRADINFRRCLGHRDDIWSNDAVFRAHIKGGIRWALGLE